MTLFNNDNSADITEEGSWSDYLSKFNYKEQVISDLQKISENLRLHCKDKCVWLIVHRLLRFKKGFCVKKIIALI